MLSAVFCQAQYDDTHSQCPFTVNSPQVHSRQCRELFDATGRGIATGSMVFQRGLNVDHFSEGSNTTENM